MNGAAPLAATVVIPATLAIALTVLGVIVGLGVLVALLRHGGMDRRVAELERQAEASIERDRRIDTHLQQIMDTQRHATDLLHTIIKGHMGNGRSD